MAKEILDIRLSRKELAGIVDYTYRRLHDIDKSLPEEAKLFVEGDDKKCSLSIFVQRWVDYNVGQSTEGTLNLEVVKAQHEAVKMEKTTLEVAKMRAELVPLTDLKKLWGDIAKTITLNLIHLPSKVAPLLLNQNNVEVIAAIIAEEMNTCLNDISETPVPDYVREAQEEDEEGEEETEV